MKYKIGDKFTIIEDYKEWDCIDEFRNGKNFKNEIVKISRIIENCLYYGIEVLNCSYKKKCPIFDKTNICICLAEHEIKPIN